MSRRRLNLSILVVLLMAAAALPASSQTPPDQLRISLAVEVPPPPAEILSFSHSAQGPVRPGAEVVFEAEAIVPDGGAIFAHLAGASWKVALRPTGGQNYRATAIVPESVRPGQYGVNVSIEGVDSPQTTAAANRLVVQAAPKPEPPPVVVPVPSEATACRDALTRIEKLAVRFPFDVPSPTPAGIANLNRIAELLSGINGQRTWKLTVTGYCDERGTPGYNEWLGGARAKQVKEFLVTETNVASSRIVTISRGASDPVDTSLTVAGYAKNRRVEFALDCGE